MWSHHSSRRLFSVWVAVLMLACTRDSTVPPGAVLTGHDAALPDATSSLVLDAQADDAAVVDAAESAAARGAVLYGRMCAVCHGVAGQGYAADEATALAHPDFLATVSDDFLRFAIAVGRRGTKMSAWQTDHAGPLSAADISDVVAHLRSWQKPASSQPEAEGEPLPAAKLQGDAERGSVVFKRSCERCHGPKAPYVHILNRQLLLYASADFLRHAIEKGRAPTKMPGFKKSLGERGIADVVAYLKSLPAELVPGEVPGYASPPPIPLGPVPLHPRGPEPKGFRTFPEATSVGVVGPQFKRGARMVLLDARAPSDYLNSHIAGAVSVPFYDPYPYIADLPKNTWLVCYCGCPHAESGQLAQRLQAAGFRKVTILDEGLGAWSEKGYPMHQGIAP